MASADNLAISLLNRINAVPRERLDAVTAVAKSAKLRGAVRKADDDTLRAAQAAEGDESDTQIQQNALDALQAAGKILAPYVDLLSRGTMDDLADALGIEPDDGDDGDDEAGEPLDQDTVDSIAADAAAQKADDASDPDDRAKQAKKADGDGLKADAEEDRGDDRVKRAKKSDQGDAEDDVDLDQKQAQKTRKADAPDADDEDLGPKQAKKAAGDDADASTDDPVGKADPEDLSEAGKAAAESDDAQTTLDIAKAQSMPDFDGATDADKEAAITAARQAYAAAMKQRGLDVAKTKKSDDMRAGGNLDVEEGKSEVAKSALASLSKLPEAQRRLLTPVIKSQFDRIAELERAHKTAVAKSQKLEAETRRKAYVAKAAAEFPGAGTPEELGTLLYNMELRDPEGAKTLTRVLKAQQAQAQMGGERGLFGEVGTRMSNVSGGDAHAKLDAAVDSIVQKSAGGKSRDQLMAEFLQTPAGRALYNETRQSR